MQAIKTTFWALLLLVIALSGSFVSGQDEFTTLGYDNVTEDMNTTETTTMEITTESMSDETTIALEVSTLESLDNDTTTTMEPDTESEPEPEPETESKEEKEPKKESLEEKEPKEESEEEKEQKKESKEETEPESDSLEKSESEPEPEPEDSLLEEEMESGVEKSGEKCKCRVSEVLVSMNELIKDLSDELKSMKKQMVKACPGFEGAANETDSEDSSEKVDDSLAKMNATAEKGENITTTTPLPPIPNSCKSPFQLVASSCYYFLYYPQDWKSWGAANAYCQNLGGTLAAPYRLEELTTYLSDNFSNVFWVGAKKASGKKTYKWLTGKFLKDEDWKKGHPKKPAKKHCVYLESFSGYKAVNHYCGEKFSFVCEQRATPDDQLL